MKVDISIQGLAAVTATLEGFSERRLRAAAATGITRTAQAIKAAEQAEIPRVFDRPTPYTLNSLFMRPATAQRLEAEVYVKDDLAGSGTPATKYLLPNVDGGQRHIKRMERALQAVLAMPVGWQAVPATGPNSAVRWDAYGNVSRGQIIQIVSQLGTELTAGYNRTAISVRDKRKGAQSARRRALGRAGGQYVAVVQPKGKLKPGVYLAEGRDFGARLGYGRNGRLKPVFLYVKSTTYKMRFDFGGVAQRVAAELLVPNVMQAIDEQVERLRAARGDQ